MINACHSSATLVETCRAYAPDGGCRVCNGGYYGHKTCVGCRAEYLTCTGGDGCSASWTHFMTVDGECKDEVVGCAVEISSDVVCASFLPGYFSKDQTCLLCNATFDRCSVCDGEVCICRLSDRVLSGGACLHFADVAHCTAADDSKCTKSAFWHEPTASGDECTKCAVWWVILLGLVGALLIILFIVVFVVVLIHAALNLKQRRDIARTVHIFNIPRSDIDFTSTRVEGIVTSTRCVGFDGAIPVDAESKALLCIGNTGRKRLRVKVAGKDRNERRLPRVMPGQQLHHRAHNVPPTVGLSLPRHRVIRLLSCHQLSNLISLLFVTHVSS